MQGARRRFLLQSGALVAAAFGPACRESTPEGLSVAPASGSRTWRRVTQALAPQPAMEGAGVHIARGIGQQALRNLDPFILLDRFHSTQPSDYLKGFPSHPHRGFETVTVMLSGRVRHADSRGNRGLITGGGAQWMTAGRGIVHSEMPEPPESPGPGGSLMSGFQLWINLPASEKMCSQVYQDLQPAELREDRLSPAGSAVRMIAGNGGPVRERPTSPLLMTLALEDDRPFDLDTPKDHQAFVFVGGGAVAVGAEDASTVVADGTLAVLGTGDRLRLRATERRCDVLIAAARPIREPIVQRGPFVMNTEAEIRRAWEDYRAGTLDKA